MVTVVAPAGRHDKVKEFVFETGGKGDVSGQQDKFAEIEVDKATRVDGPGYTVFDRQGTILGLIGAEDTVPDVEQVAEVGVDIQGIACVVNTMMGRGEDKTADKAEAGIANQVFADMDKTAPRAVNGHDQEEQWGI